MSMPSQEQFALLTDYDIGSPYSEAYHTIYANICFNLDGPPETLHTLLLTTVSTHTSLPSFAANIAIVAAQSGTPTILVDADLRTPSLERRFGLEKSSGLRDLLQEDALTSQKVRQHIRKTFVTNLQLLSAGNATVSEGAILLFSARLTDIIAAMRQHLAETQAGKAGMIIFNAPPVLTGPDASLLGTHVEQTILAIVKGRTTRSQAREAQEQLQRAHANLVGVVTLDV